MKHDKKIWLQKLKKHIAQCRALRPIPERDTLSLPQILQLHIIKGSLTSWLNNLSSSLSQSHDEQGGHEICIVFTSNAPGLAASQETSLTKKLPFVSLFPEEFSVFLQRFPDGEYRYHVHIWSHMLEMLDSDTTRIAERYPLNNKEKYWLHVEGIMQGSRIGRGVEHLWGWNGSQTILLKKSLHHWAA